MNERADDRPRECPPIYGKLVMMYIEHVLPAHIALGIVRAEGVVADRSPTGFDEALQAVQQRRGTALDAAEEAIRCAARDMLRNGRYKPTGRGKPSSEYLVRAVQDDERLFPRINAPVDICNLMSLETLLPISLWDLDLAGSSRFRFRLGQAGEVYVFNEGGQTINLEDLVVGCRMTDGADEPIVNPIKDSLATKTTPATTRVAACVYSPLGTVSPERLDEICAVFAGWLAGAGDGVTTSHGIVHPGESADV